MTVEGTRSRTTSDIVLLGNGTRICATLLCEMVNKLWSGGRRRHVKTPHMAKRKGTSIRTVTPLGEITGQAEDCIRTASIDFKTPGNVALPSHETRVPTAWMESSWARRSRGKPGGIAACRISIQWMTP
jgi:hypothetical protein